jgi:hypothetical protein
LSFKQISAEQAPARRSPLLKKFQGAFSERPIEPVEVEPSTLRRWTRRDVLLLGAGALATLAVGGSQLPRKLLQQLRLDPGGTTGPDKWLLNKALRLDDEVSMALYSQHHLVPTYTKSEITPLKNNYNGATPDPAYLAGWRLTLDGLSSGLSVSLDVQALLARHRIHAQARQKDLSLMDRHVLRLEKAKPLLEQINTGIQAARAGTLPQSALAKACNYTLTLWTRLGRFLEYPEVELSNNLAENAMRPVVLGRKNWIHVGSKDAGPRVAAIISIVETCRRLSLPIRDYLASVLPALADFPRNRVAELTPSAWAAKVKASKSGGAGPVFV